MNFNPRVLKITNQQQAIKELNNIRCDPAGTSIMCEKAVYKTIKLENVATKAANLLKQTFLAKGGEAAVARNTADLSEEFTDVLICATAQQMKLALNQLQRQPWGLPDIVREIEQVLANYDGFPERHYVWPGKQLDILPRHTLVMGILNITPDSFSDGGRYNSVEKAVTHAQQLIADGAEILDIGAESTRPYGSTPVSAAEELERLVPVLERVIKMSSVPVSIDTYKAEVADKALQMGAHIINDIWGLQYDPNMAEVVARHRAPVIIMHNHDGMEYQRDIMSHICSFLRKSIAIGTAAGIQSDRFIIDPGIGFAKNGQRNLEVMSRLEELKSIGCPILLGTSRKRFIGDILGLPVDERVEGTSATVAVGIVRGANIVRVHDVKPIARIVRMTDALL